MYMLGDRRQDQSLRADGRGTAVSLWAGGRGAAVSLRADGRGTVVSAWKMRCSIFNTEHSLILLVFLFSWRHVYRRLT